MFAVSQVQINDRVKRVRLKRGTKWRRKNVYGTRNVSDNLSILFPQET